MRYGVLCDQQGMVKRTWALMHDMAIVPVEHNDYIIEWNMDHGEDTLDPIAKSASIQAAAKEQERTCALKTRTAVLAHGERYKHGMVTQLVVNATPSVEPVFYSNAKGLHHRTVDKDGNVQERDVHPSNKLHIVADAKKERD